MPDPKRTFLRDTGGVTFEEATVAVFPVPYEGTVSYGTGASRGPDAILAASHEIESSNDRMPRIAAELSIWTDPPPALADLPPREAVRQVHRRFGELMDAGKWVVMLGGEHSITPGGVAAAKERHEDLHVVQLDAHADLRDSYRGERWSHGCAMARCLDLSAVVHAVGIRSRGPEEARRIERGIPGYSSLPAWELETEGWIDRALQGVSGRQVYLTVDVDYFDPAVVPATGTPEPGGGRWWPTLSLLEELFDRADVVAADVVELAPIAGLHHADFTVARLVYELVALAGKTSASGPP